MVHIFSFLFIIFEKRGGVCHPIDDQNDGGELFQYIFLTQREFPHGSRRNLGQSIVAPGI